MQREDYYSITELRARWSGRGRGWPSEAVHRFEKSPDARLDDSTRLYLKLRVHAAEPEFDRLARQAEEEAEQQRQVNDGVRAILKQTPAERKAEKLLKEKVKEERIASLRALGHSGDAEKHARGILRHLANFGLVYEKTARKLLGDMSQKDFRALVPPERWIPNPAYSTAPKVPVYDPRTLLIFRRALECCDDTFLERCRQAQTERRHAIDSEVREEYREFRERARRV